MVLAFSGDPNNTRYHLDIPSCSWTALRISRCAEREKVIVFVRFMCQFKFDRGEKQIKINKIEREILSQRMKRKEQNWIKVIFPVIFAWDFRFVILNSICRNGVWVCVRCVLVLMYCDIRLTAATKYIRWLNLHLAAIRTWAVLLTIDNYYLDFPGDTENNYIIRWQTIYSAADVPNKWNKLHTRLITFCECVLWSDRLDRQRIKMTFDRIAA